MTTTTIKVSRELRDRINRDAGERGLTAAGLLTELVDEYEREQRFAAFGRAFVGVDKTYTHETDAWDAASADGLPDE